MPEFGRLFIGFRTVSWGSLWIPRRNVYDNKYEHLEYLYIGRLNLIVAWEKKAMKALSQRKET